MKWERKHKGEQRDIYVRCVSIVIVTHTHTHHPQGGLMKYNSPQAAEWEGPYPDWENALKYTDMQRHGRICWIKCIITSKETHKCQFINEECVWS